MAYTTGNNFTVAPGFTTGTNISLNNSFTLSVPVTFKNFEAYSLAIPVTVDKFEAYSLSVPITFNNVFALRAPVRFEVYEALDLSVPVEFDLYETVNLTVPLSFTQYESYLLGAGVNFITFEVYGLEVPLSIHVYWQLVAPVTFTKYETYVRNIPLTFSQYEAFGLGAPISFEVLSNLWKLSAGVNFINYESFVLSIGTQFEVTETLVSLGVPITFKNFESLVLTAPVRIEVLPAITSGVGEQGVGGVVINPEDYTQRWSLRVTLNGTDVSGRLTGTLMVDAEENSAVVAVFSLKPNAGRVDPYAWTRKPVTIEYLEKDANGDVVSAVLLFRGLVDSPEYDTNTRVTTLNCTDNLQNVVQGMTRSAIDALTPNAKWSRYVFDESTVGWEYLQQRLSTYHYVAGLDTNGRLVIKNWQSGSIKFEFTDSTILDGSLSLTIANARDIVNSVTVSLSTQAEVFRESVLNLRWSEEAWFSYSYLNWYPCSVQMICDAVANAGASFVDVPQFNMTPSSRWKDGPNGATFGFINPGTELNCIEFVGRVSKRWKQSVSSVSRVVVQSLESIGEVGLLPETVEGSVVAQYNNLIEDYFLNSQQMNWFQCSAGTGISGGSPTWEIPAGTPLLLQGDGFVSYPMLGFTFQVHTSNREKIALQYGLDLLGNAYETYSNISDSGTVMQSISAYQSYQDSMSYLNLTGGLDLSQYDHRLDVSEGDYAITGAAGGHGLPGEHIYDFDDFLVQGNQDDRQGAFDVLKAQGITKILSAHRQNRVGFSTVVNPQVHRGDTLRVNTSTLKARGVAAQVTHSFDIDSGEARTSVALAVSTPKSAGIVDSTVTGVVLRIPIEFEVGISITPAGALKVPAGGGSVHDMTLPCHYYSSGSPEPAWTGHISPRNYIGSNEFVVTFPSISQQVTDAAEVISENKPYIVKVPRDELITMA